MPSLESSSTRCWQPHVNLCKFSPKLIMLLFDSPYEIYWLSPTSFAEKIFFFFGARSKGKKRSDGDSGANKNNIIFQVLSHRQTWNWGLLFTRLTYNRMEGNRSDQVFVISRVCSSHLSEEYITKGDIQPELCNGGRVKRSSSPSTSHNIHFHSAASGRRCQGWL